MRAIVQHGYGAPEDVLRLADVEIPMVGDQGVLVRVRASSANPWDWHFIRGEPVLLRPAGIGGVRKPKFSIPGGDLAGTVEQVGSRVTTFNVGDEVYGFGHGAFAEYIAVDQGNLAAKPTSLTFEQAAAVPLAAVTALQCLRAGGIQPGQHIVVVGASGGVGTFAVQIAKHLGAEVTGVCSTGNLDLVRRLGAEHIVDYTNQDFTIGAARYDLALQLGGTYSPAAIRKSAHPARDTHPVLRRRQPLVRSGRQHDQGCRPQRVRRADPQVVHCRGHHSRPERGRPPHRGRPYHSRDRPELPTHRCRRRGAARRGGKPSRQGHRYGCPIGVAAATPVTPPKSFPIILTFPTRPAAGTGIRSRGPS